MLTIFILLFFVNSNTAAIRFVLSDLFQNLRSEDRHALLHVWLIHFALLMSFFWCLECEMLPKLCNKSLISWVSDSDL